MREIPILSQTTWEGLRKGERGCNWNRYILYLRNRQLADSHDLKTIPSLPSWSRNVILPLRFPVWASARVKTGLTSRTVSLCLSTYWDMLEQITGKWSSGIFLQQDFVFDCCSPGWVLHKSCKVTEPSPHGLCTCLSSYRQNCQPGRLSDRAR